jgi:hypothetical protein
MVSHIKCLQEMLKVGNHKKILITELGPRHTWHFHTQYCKKNDIAIERQKDIFPRLLFYCL